MPNYRVSLAFAEISDAALVDFTSTVITGLTGNDLFPTPPIALTEVQRLQTEFERSLAKSALGGKQATAEKNQVRAALLEALRKTAAYVQMQMNNELASLLSSGFDAVSGRSPSEPLPAPAILRIESPESTRMALKVTPIPNARAYEVRKMNGTGGWVPASIGTKSRRLEVDGLVPGSKYQFQVRAIGGSTGTGPLEQSGGAHGHVTAPGRGPGPTMRCALKARSDGRPGSSTRRSFSFLEGRVSG